MSKTETRYGQCLIGSAIVPFRLPAADSGTVYRTTSPQLQHDAMLVRVIVIATCLSVRPSVTRRYCVKTKKASGIISSPSGSPKTLVF